ncbi:zinc-binding dehydrogenase [Eubacteriales bacterium OttesenSCG-928-N14]|nr:zinc-binding dehydrogenase [Eubacteriales bacterium OttesenSCG-928-N14]
MKTKSWVVVEPERMELQEFDVPTVDDDGILMRVTMVSICGSDPKYYFGHQNTEYLPMIMGHEVVGVVEEIGREAEQTYGVKKGDRITVEPYANCGECDFCQSGYYQLCRNTYIYGCKKSCKDEKHLWGGYGEFLYIGPGSHVYLVGDDIPDEAAVFSSVIGNGYRMMKTKGEVDSTKDVVVWGPGALGLCGVVAAKELGARQIIVVGLEKDSIRLQLAKELGADHIIMSDKVNAVDEIKRLTGGEGAHVSVECTGFPKIYNDVIFSTRTTGTIVLIGLNSKQDNPVYTDNIIQRELTVKGCVGQPHNCEDAMETINNGIYPIEKMATHAFTMDRMDEAFQFSLSNDPSLIRVVVTPEEK